MYVSKEHTEYEIPKKWNNRPWKHENNTLEFQRWWLSQWRTCLWGRRARFYPWVRETPWRRKWPPIPVFSPGEFYEQRRQSLAGSWGVAKSWTRLSNEHTTQCNPNQNLNKFFRKLDKLVLKYTWKVHENTKGPKSQRSLYRSLRQGWWQFFPVINAVSVSWSVSRSFS